MNKTKESSEKTAEKSSKAPRKPHSPRRPKEPNALFYHLFYWGFSLYFRLTNKITDNAKELKNIKGPALVLSTHPSLYDFYYAARALYPKRLTVVANRYYASVSPTAWLLKRFRVIPKSLFTKDIETVKKILAAAKSGHILLMMPEGRMSTSGDGFPLASGTAELVKKLGVDVYKIDTRGAYHAKPKWAFFNRRAALEITGKKLFSAGELAEKTLLEVKSVLENELSYTSQALGKVACRDLAAGLDGVLYLCPHCKSEFTLTAGQNGVTCSRCGMTAVMDEYCRFVSGRFATIAEWYRFQEGALEQNFEKTSLEAAVTVKKIDKKKKRMEVCGFGVCSLDKTRFAFRGELMGQKDAFEIPLDALEALPFTAGEEFELYRGGELYYFYPAENPNQCVKWSLFVDIYNKKSSDYK